MMFSYYTGPLSPYTEGTGDDMTGIKPVTM